LLFAEGLNADYVKGENLEAVVCEEPQGKDFSVTVPDEGFQFSVPSTE
jgi:hypothetical protein